MEQTRQFLDGWLTTGEKKVPIKARFASRYSILVDVDGVKMGPEVENCTLTVEDKAVDLGPVRLLPQTDGEAGRRLMTAGRIHDFEKLFFHAALDTIESAFMNLALVLSYKDSIDETFRHFVSDLTYDLNVYGHLLDQVDQKSADEPPAVREHVVGDIINTIGRDLVEYLDSQQAELARIVSGFPEDEHEHHGFYFRRQLWNILMRTPIMARTNLKPRGYNGDSEMMRMIYMNDYQGETLLGKILHKYSMSQPAAQAVRNRRLEVAEMLHRYAQSAVLPEGEKLKVLSVACGPAFEVREILRTAGDCARMHFSLFDQDQQALLEAAGLVNEIERTLHAEVSVDFIKESVRTMLVTRALQDRWGQFNFIYSMGLFDYLTAPVATAVIKKLYQLLKPGGEMVIGNFVAGNPSRFFMEYWHDWKIIYRSEEDFRQITAELEDAEISVHFDETKIQMLLRVRKLAANVGTNGHGVLEASEAGAR
jgi:extracellular factor (EF) 3-hydroxypalmitic acid methyl ester biosynthesis protein